MTDLLFLLRPDFPDADAGAGAFYCPACAEVRGLLAYYPELLRQLEVREVDYPRPRRPVAELLGAEHPGCPVLVLDETRTIPQDVAAKTAPTGRRYLDEPRAIGEYFATLHGVSRPHP